MKIMVFGLPGSGKSTFATQLAQKLNLPIYHLDKFFYVENWVERDAQEFLEIQRSFVKQPQWVIDGNCMQSLEMRFAKADVAIYFHYSRLICLWRIFIRRWQKNPFDDLPQGCKKSTRLKLIKYLWQFDKRYGLKINELHLKYPHVRFYVLKSEEEMENITNILTR